MLAKFAPCAADFCRLYGSRSSEKKLLAELQKKIPVELASTFYDSSGLVASKLMFFCDADLLFLYTFHPELDRFTLKEGLSDEELFKMILIGRERERQLKSNKSDLLSVICNLGLPEVLKMIAAFAENMYTKKVSIATVISTESIIEAIPHLLIFSQRESADETAACMLRELLALPQHRLTEHLTELEFLFVDRPALCGHKLHHTLLSFIERLPGASWDSSVIYTAEAAGNTALLAAYKTYVDVEEMLSKERLSHTRLTNGALQGDWGEVRHVVDGARHEE